MFHRWHWHGWGITPSLVHFLHTYRLGGLFLLLLVEEAGVPIPLPGDMLVALAGAQPQLSVGYVLRVITVSTVAVFLGSSLLYWVIRRGGRPLLLRLGRYLHLHPQRLERLEHWFVRYGAVTIVVGRLIPGLRVPTTVMAGLAGVRYRVYAPASALSALLWSAFYFWLGRLARPYLGVVTAFGLGLLDNAEDSLLLTLLLAGLVVLLIAGGWRLYQHRQQQIANAEAPAEASADDETEVEPTSRPASRSASRPASDVVGNG